MSKRAKTISWLEGKIISELSEKGASSCLSLSSLVLRNISSIDEEYNLDIALINLLSKGHVSKSENDGKTVHKLVA